MEVQLKLYCHIGEYDGFFRRSINLPFVPMRGMELMIGESSDWNHLRVDSVLWDTESQSFSLDCDWVHLRDSLDFERLRELLLTEGFKWDGDEFKDNPST